MFTLLVTLFVIIAFAVPGAAELLQYDRLALASGELHRVLTCHLVHWSFDHVLWDVTVFVVLGLVCERRDRRRFYLCLLTAAVAVPVAVWLWLPDMQLYRGLSGIDSAVFALLAAMMIRSADWNDGRRRFLVALTMVLAFAVKTVVELRTGEAVFASMEAIDVVTVPLAHAAGALVGIAIGLFPLPRMKAWPLLEARQQELTHG